MSIFLQIFITIFIFALIPLLIYALTSCGKKFDFLSWLILTRTRLFIGLGLIICFSICLAFIPESAEVLATMGFDTKKSVAAVGLALGAMLVASIRGNAKK